MRKTPARGPERLARSETDGMIDAVQPVWYRRYEQDEAGDDVDKIEIEGQLRLLRSRFSFVTQYNL